MKPLVILLAGVLASPVAFAEDSCAVQAARLMSPDRVKDLAGMFTAPSEAVSRSLAQLVSTVGPIDQVAAASTQPAGRTVRRSVAVSPLPNPYRFEGSWAVAVSKTGVRYVLQASAEPSSRCRLLAVHVDVAAK